MSVSRFQGGKWVSASVANAQRVFFTGLVSANYMNLREMARPTGFEPVTFGVGDRYSIQLNYGRNVWILTEFDT